MIGRIWMVIVIILFSVGFYYNYKTGMAQEDMGMRILYAILNAILFCFIALTSIILLMFLAAALWVTFLAILGSM